MSAPKMETNGTNTERPSQDSDDGSSRVQLERRLELHHGVAVIAGLTIGGGIFVSPAGVTAGAGSGGLSLVLWCFGGFISILGMRIINV